MLKELLRFYRDHGSTMFVCFLNASKAFDRVDYCVLFHKLVSRYYRLRLFVSCGSGIVVILHESSGPVYFLIIFLYAVVSEKLES